MCNSRGAAPHAVFTMLRYPISFSAFATFLSVSADNLASLDLSQLVDLGRCRQDDRHRLGGGPGPTIALASPS